LLGFSVAESLKSRRFARSRLSNAATQQPSSDLASLSPFSLTAVVEKQIFTPAPERALFGTFTTLDV